MKKYKIECDSEIHAITNKLITQNARLYFHPRMKIFIDTTPRNFHGYTIHWDGTVIGKTGKVLKTVKRDRRGGGYDLCVHLYYNKKKTKWTLQRLIASCFLGNIDGKEVNHDDRNPLNCDGSNLDIFTRSQNQQHWRNHGRDK